MAFAQAEGIALYRKKYFDINLRNYIKKQFKYKNNTIFFWFRKS